MLSPSAALACGSVYESNRDLIQSVTNHWAGTDPEDIVSKCARVNVSRARKHADAKPSAWHPAPGATE